MCNNPEEKEKRIPLDQILILIAAAKGITFSSNSISKLLAADSIILHCDERYKPIGKTANFSSIIHSDVFENQITIDQEFNQTLWKDIITAKFKNQAKLLDRYMCRHLIHEFIHKDLLDEGNISRHYWKRYFGLFRGLNVAKRSYRNAIDLVNSKLNYSYAVVNALLHRSICGHGLTPLLGIHHKFRFKAEPLIYDLMEPLRPFCDMIIVDSFLAGDSFETVEWIKGFSKKLLEIRVKYSGPKYLKLIYAIDKYVSSVADSFKNKCTSMLYVPLLENIRNGSKQV